MIHTSLPKKFCFISEFDKHHISNLDKNTSIIYRNYSINDNKKLIQKINIYCKKEKRKFFISNNIRLAINLNLDGAYLPSFNRRLNINIPNRRKKFLIIGSAHSVEEIKIKEKQGVEMIFLSPLFKTQKNNHFLDTIKFKLLTLNTNKKIIALGGINRNNVNKLNMLNLHGFAGISYFQNNDKIKHFKG
jgi:thiamine-phosphate pyrophosphorylase